MPWIIIDKPKLALKVMNLIESRFPDAEQCVQAGDGVQETRPEYLFRYRGRVMLRQHPDGVRVGIWLNAAAYTRYQAWRAQLATKRAAGALDADEAEADAFPPDVPALDASWDGAPPPQLA